MTKSEIIKDIADHKVVEKMVVNIAHHPMSADLEDLVQMVYLALLEYDEKSVVEMYDAGQIRFFIARIIMNQYRSEYSPFYRIIRKYQRRSGELKNLDILVEEEDIHEITDDGVRTPRRRESEDALEELVCEFKDIRKEYAYNDSVLSLDSPRMRRLKHIVDKELDAVDRTIIILYADCQSLRDLGKQMGVSHATIGNEVKRIRKKIIDKMNE